MRVVDLPQPEKHKLSDLPVLYRDMWETSTLKRLTEAAPDLFVHGWIAGGAVRRAMLGTEGEAQKSSDIDLFFPNPICYDAWKLSCDRRGFNPPKEKTHATEYTAVISGVNVKLQAIRGRWFENSRALIDDFDFTHCQFVIGGDWLTIGPTSANDAMRKRLVCANTRAPVAMIRRICKYQGEGFKITDAQIKTLLRATVSSPDTIDAKLLEEYVE